MKNAPKHTEALAEGLWGAIKQKGRLRRPGDDLLSRALRHSTISAKMFHGRVRDGNVWDQSCNNHQAV